MESGKVEGKKIKRGNGEAWMAYKDSVLVVAAERAKPTFALENAIKDPEPEPKKKKRPGNESKYERHRAKMAEVSAEESKRTRNIHPIPACSDPELREALRLDLLGFLEKAFPETFYLGWSEDQIEIISEVQRTILHGGMKGITMPRHGGKTSISRGAVLWATLYAHRKFVVAIASEQEKADMIVEQIKLLLETNTLICGLFPEVSYPIRRLEGISSRARAQHLNGALTRIKWGTSKIIYPTILDAPTSGTIVCGAGITSSKLRGICHVLTTGETIRPDFFIADDCQDDSVAASPIQCQAREKKIMGAIKGMAGPGKKMSGFNLCTVIYEDDLTSRILKRPEWHGKIYSILKSLPKNLIMWEKDYRDLWLKSLKERKDISLASEFYRANKEKMSEGAEVSWKEDYEPGETDALEHAMLLYISDEEVFWAEYMNRPKPRIVLTDRQLTPDDIYKCAVGIGRGEVPVSTVELTAFIDVHDGLLFWMVCALSQDFSGGPIDYGSFPEQPMDYYTLSNAKRKFDLSRGIEASLYDALKDLVGQLMSKDWVREHGGTAKISRISIDAGWMTDIVYQFIRESDYAPILLPSNGKFFGAASNPISSWQQHEGERHGLNYIISLRGKHKQYHIVFDANWWKDFVFQRILTHRGNPGGMTIFGKKPEAHQMLADHLTSETRHKIEGRGRVVYEYRILPNRENHLFDCLVGCYVAGSIQGCVLSKEAQRSGEESQAAEKKADDARAREVLDAIDRQRKAAREKSAESAGTVPVRPVSRGVVYSARRARGV